MLARTHLKALAAAMIVALPIPSSGAVDAFLKLTGIKGESIDSKHKDEIDVLSWSWGAGTDPALSTSARGAGAARPCVKDFTFTHRFDAASPLLLTSAISGNTIPEGTLTIRKAEGLPATSGVPQGGAQDDPDLLDQDRQRNRR